MRGAGSDSLNAQRTDTNDFVKDFARVVFCLVWMGNVIFQGGRLFECMPLECELIIFYSAFEYVFAAFNMKYNS